MIILLNFLLLIAGLAAVIKGADFLVDGSSDIAKKLKIPEIIIGLTIVAFGTSLPELVVNIFASIQKENQIILGNIIGSNIINILLILGVSAVIFPLSVKRNTVWREIPFTFFSVVILFLLANDGFFFNSSKEYYLSRINGAILLTLFAIFIVYIFFIIKIESDNEPDIKTRKMPLSILFIFLGFAGLFIGGKLVVDNAVKIADFFKVSNKLIALTIISLGTSVPELATSTIAAIKKKNDIAIGNIVGSNIFNILLVLGISAVINPIKFVTVLNIDLVILMAASLFLFATMFTGKKNKLDRWEAIIFLIMYSGYLVYIIIRK